MNKNTLLVEIATEELPPNASRLLLKTLQASNKIKKLNGAGQLFPPHSKTVNQPLLRSALLNPVAPTLRA